MKSVLEVSEFDLTCITDVLVPVYSVLVLMLIVAHCKTPQTEMEEKYLLKRIVKTVEKKNWREVMTGYFHQSDSNGFDDWLKFLKKPFAVRLIAPKMFHRIHMDLKVGDKELVMQRFWEPEKAKGDVIVTVTLGTSEEDAPPTTIKTDVSDECGVWRAWVPEGEEKLYTYFIPDDLAVNPKLYVTREVIDDNTLLCSWEGHMGGNTCCMTTTYRRVS